MKILIAGGSGYLGRVLATAFERRGDDVVILSRSARPKTGRIQTYVWDGCTVGAWYQELEGADVLVNLTGRSVDCRYNTTNRKLILESRVNSAGVLKQVWPLLKKPPHTWIQMSSATIYRHAEDRPMTEADGEFGEGFSVDVCRAWEGTFLESDLAATRKVILRTSIVLGRAGGALPTLVQLCRAGFGGKAGNGKQMVSWIHEEDFAGIIHWLLERRDVCGVLNCTSPWPLPNALFTEVLSNTLKTSFRFSMPEWMIFIGAWLVRTEPELVLKSRWTLPSRLISEGYIFKYPRLKNALASLYAKD